MNPPRQLECSMSERKTPTTCTHWASRSGQSRHVFSASIHTEAPTFMCCKSSVDTYSAWSSVRVLNNPTTEIFCPSYQSGCTMSSTSEGLYTVQAPCASRARHFAYGDSVRLGF